ncbi:MAG TPA: cytochrome c [Bacteroidia bacterium]|jgi:mono/diheme cytochrome c family protein|nr:cytochrome c [Bacteroidia bacterium]
MFQILFQTHKIVVLLFLIIYLVKTTLLLANKQEGLERFKKITKVPEMIVSFLFLATGIYLITQIPEIKSLLIIKLVAVALSIPIAVIGFRKNNKVLATLSLVLIIAAYGLAEMSKKQASSKQPEEIKETTIGPAKGDTAGAAAPDVKSDYNVEVARKRYINNCSKCHGADGKAMIAGAADLTKSTMDAWGAKDIVTEGKGSMPGFGEHMNTEEITSMVNYIQSFKTKK